MNNKTPPNSNKKFLLRYASLGTQLLVAIGIGVFAGLKADNWLNTLPLFSCLLPLLILAGIFYKLAKETKPSGNEK
jgi:Putative F0F1-ATPase subunit Ca2+/Mg2+ transporter